MTVPPEPSDTHEPEEPPDELANTDFPAWNRANKAYWRHQIMSAERRAERRINETTTRDANARENRIQHQGFIDRVGRRFSHLDGERDIIIGAMAKVTEQNPGVPLQISDPQTVELVGAAASQEMIRIAARTRGLDEGGGSKPPRLEGQTSGSAHVTHREPKVEKRTRPISIAEIQANKRNARRKAGAASGRG